MFKRIGAVVLATGIVLAGSVVTAVAAGPGTEVDPSMGTVQGNIVASQKACKDEEGANTP